MESKTEIGNNSYQGIPAGTYKVLPKQVKNLLEKDRVYNSDTIEELIVGQFESQTIQDIAVLFVELWEQEFHRREEFSQNLSEFYIRELAKHTNIPERSYRDIWSGLESSSWEYLGYKLNGYNAAIEGKNDGVIQLLYEFSNTTGYFPQITSGSSLEDIETARFIKLEHACKKLRLYGEGYGHAMFAEYIRTAQSSYLTTAAVSKKLKWLGSPAQFGFIIQELIDKGYLEKPSSSYTKDAKLYLQMFEIRTTQQTIAKEISPSESQNSLSAGNRVKFAIPHINRL